MSDTHGKGRSPVDGIRSRHVLIVEDHADLLGTLADALTLEGWRVSTSPSAEQALVLIAVEPPDLLLLDLRLPGTSGFELSRLLASDAGTARIPILAMTGLGAAAGAMARAAGCAAVLHKPFELAVLIDMVRTLLDHHAPAERLEALELEAKSRQRR